MQAVQFCQKFEIGDLYIIASPKGLRGVHWSQQAVPLVTALDEASISHAMACRHIKNAIAQLSEYFLGKRRSFDLIFDLEGTDFENSVWRQLSKIPYGKTTSYKNIAELINNPKAVRAVGSANGKNPLCIVVPCHRVIASDGTLGGYVGGLKIKSELLALEAAL